MWGETKPQECSDGRVASAFQTGISALFLDNPRGREAKQLYAGPRQAETQNILDRLLI